MSHPGQASVTIYPVSSYQYGTKPPKFEKDSTPAMRMERMKDKYQREGVRRTVDGVLIVHEHSHPHILLVQVGSSFFKLPGGRLRPGEDEVEGLTRKLNNLLAPASSTFKPNWRVGECLATYYRPNFENAVYPYCPAHVTRPKEMKRIWHVVLPDRSYFSIPKNMRLVAVPLFEIYDNAQRYGPIIASIPQLLSRFQFILAGAGKASSIPASLPASHSMPQQHPQQQQQQGFQQQQGMQQQQPQQQQYQPPPMQQQGMQPQQRMGISVNLLQPQQQQQPMDGMRYHQQQQPAADDLFVDFDEM